MDQGAGADDEHEVAARGGVLGAGDGVGGEHLTEPYDAGSHHSAAGGAVGDFVGEVLGGGSVLLATIGATVDPNVAVQLDDVLAARLVVQAVDVLGDEGELRCALFEVGEGEVSGVGFLFGELGAAVEVESPDLVGVTLESLGSGEVFSASSLPESAWSSEGGDAAFGADAGAGEAADVSGLLDESKGCGDILMLI